LQGLNLLGQGLDLRGQLGHLLVKLLELDNALKIRMHVLSFAAL
jgi:hypothetical protein